MRFLRTLLLLLLLFCKINILAFFYSPFKTMISFSLLSTQLSTGSQDGRVHVWGSDSGQKLTVLEGNHPGPIQCVGFNPKYMMLASACTNMVS